MLLNIDVINPAVITTPVISTAVLSTAVINTAIINTSNDSFHHDEKKAEFDPLKEPDAYSAARTASRSIRLDRANFRGLVLGCIEAKFRKKICV